MAGKFEISYGRTRDGLLVAKIDDGSRAGEVYGAVPRRAGGFLVSSLYYNRRGVRFEEMTAKDFPGNLASAPDVAAFRRFIEDQAEHLRQRDGFRREYLETGLRTPLGVATLSTKYAEGVVHAEGQGFRGFFLSAARNEAVPSVWRRADRYYNYGGLQDGRDWAKVVASLPELFTNKEKRDAERTLRSLTDGTYARAMPELAARGVQWAKMATQDFRPPPEPAADAPGAKQTFRVRWEIDVEASDEREAAARAGEVMQAIDHAPSFDVRSPEGKITAVDLVPRNDEEAWRLLDMRREKRLAEIEDLDARRMNDSASPSP